MERQIHQWLVPDGSKTHSSTTFTIIAHISPVFTNLFQFCFSLNIPALSYPTLLSLKLLFIFIETIFCFPTKIKIKINIVLRCSSIKLLVLYPFNSQLFFKTMGFKLHVNFKRNLNIKLCLVKL